MVTADQNSQAMGVCCTVRPQAAPQAAAGLSLATASSDGFSSLGMGEEQIEAYLSDAKERLRSGNPWQLDPISLVDSLKLENRADPEFILPCGMQESLVRDALKSSIIEYRSCVHHLPLALAECYKLAAAGKDPQAIYDELAKVDQEIGRRFEQNRSQLLPMIQKLQEDAEGQLAKSKACEKGAVTANLCGLVSTAMSFLSVGVLWKAFRHPEFFEKVSLSNTWYKPTHQRDSVVYYARQGSIKLNWWSGVALVFSAVSLFSLSRFFRWKWSVWQKQAKIQMQLAQASTYRHSFLQINKEMWEGMQAWVHDLTKSIAYVKELDPQREEMRKATLSDIGRKLFSLSMAVDEYIVWLQKHRMFPANFSIRNLLTPARYDRIKSIADTTEQGH